MTTVSEMIKWLETMPQDAKVSVLRHSRGTGYYDQGGWCTEEEFDPTVKESWSSPEYPYFKMFELAGGKEVGYTLLLGEVE